MTRRWFYSLALLSPAALVLATLYLARTVPHTALPHQASQRTRGIGSSQRPPNIIFMMADDLGYGDPHYNGGNADTPNLDAMADAPHSIQLLRYYSGGPTCSPTRGTVLTGRNHNRYCIWHANHQQSCSDFTCSFLMPLPTSEITVAEILKENGYRTATFGKWHLGDLSPCPLNNSHPLWPVSHPGMHGFDTWWVTSDVVQTARPNCGCFKPPNCVQSCRNYYSLDKGTGHLKSYPYRIEGDDSLFLFKLLKEFLEEVAEGEEPFFVYFNFHSVHLPVVAIGEYYQRYIERGYSKEQAHYYGSLSAMDEAVGRIRALLKNLSLSDSTMLWFTSDNGPNCKRSVVGSPGKFRGCKGSLYEGGIRVPGIVEWPAVIKHNSKSEFPVVSSDLLPTVCDILGVDPPSDRPIDGTSILPFLSGESSLRNRSIGFKFCRYQKSIIRGSYKVMKNTEETALYDLQNDPEETRDVSSEYPELFEEMKQELAEFIAGLKHSSKDIVKCTGSSRSALNCGHCLEAPPHCSLIDNHIAD